MADSTQSDCRPADICVVLAAMTDTRDGWAYADAIRGRLAILGFDLKTQQVAGMLKRLSKLDAPPIERREDWGAWVYRVTPFGETWIHNRLPAIWWAQQRSRDRLPTVGQVQG